eukprot:gene15135-6322_t
MGDDTVDGSQVISILALTAFLGAFVLAILVIFNKKKSSGDEKEENGKQEDLKAEKNEADNVNTGGKKSSTKEKFKTKSKDVVLSHPMLLTTLKGHTGRVTHLEFSKCGTYLGSCSEDRTVRLWTAKDFDKKDHKYVRANVDLDHANAVSFSPDSRAFVSSLAVDNTIRIFKISKKKDGLASVSSDTENDFPKIHKTEIIDVGISSTGKFIMSASKDTTIIIWSLKGEVLAKIDTLLIYNSHARVSPSGTLVAASGFASDIKMWSVEFDKGNGSFKQVSRALELKGHSAAVHSFSFSDDSKRVASMSKDGTWKLWDVDVNYQQGQEAYLLFTGSYASYFPEPIKLDAGSISISPDAFTVAIANGKSFILIDTIAKDTSDLLEDVHGDEINCLTWSPDSRMLISSGSSDRTIRVWHNPIGARAFLDDLKQKLSKVKSDSHKERIEQQIKDTK